MRVVIACWQMLKSTRPISWRLVPIQTKAGVIFNSLHHVGDIPWPAIKDWGEHNGLGREAIGVLATVIAKLDRDRAEQQAAEFMRATKG